MNFKDLTLLTVSVCVYGDFEFFQSIQAGYKAYAQAVYEKIFDRDKNSW